MFEEFEKVKIIYNGETGTIVDRTERNGVVKYVVEGDTYINPTGEPYCGDYPLYNCEERDLMRLPDKETQGMNCYVRKTADVA